MESSPNEGDESFCISAATCGTNCATASPTPHKIDPVTIFVMTGVRSKCPSYHSINESDFLVVVGGGGGVDEEISAVESVFVDTVDDDLVLNFLRLLNPEKQRRIEYCCCCCCRLEQSLDDALEVDCSPNQDATVTDAAAAPPPALKLRRRRWDVIVVLLIFFRKNSQWDSLTQVFSSSFRLRCFASLFGKDQQPKIRK